MKTACASRELVEEKRRALRNLGFTSDVCGGIQIDLNAALKQDGNSFTEASICDHNCTLEGGGYKCPASFGLEENRGLKKKTMAPATLLLDWILMTAQGLTLARDQFLAHHMESFYFTSDINDVAIQQALWLELMHGRVEINMFGGNPEMHPQIIQLLGSLTDRGFKVNFTTTGRRWMTDPNFADQLKGIEPAVLALSLDDMTIPELRRLAGMTLKQIRADWDGVPKTHGQKQKAREALYTLRLYQERGGYPKVSLLNMVLHAGNLEWVDEMFGVVEEVAPGTRLNPYFDQKAPDGQPGAYGERELKLAEAFGDRMIEASKDPTARIGKKMPHWLSHKAAFELHRNNPQRAADAASGHDTWRCYKNVGAGFYVQVGSSPQTVIPFSALKGGQGTEQFHPGGHLGCFWNRHTVTETRQITDSRQVFEYLMYGQKALADKAAEPCAGCRMPRLDSAHMVIHEQGLSDEIKPLYRALRQQHAGF